MSNEREGETFSRYDLELIVDNVVDIQTSGWTLKLSEERKLQENEEKYLFVGVKIGIVGYYNKGKTFIFNKLAGIHLPDGPRVTTGFLSFKQVHLGRSGYILLDSAGKGQPVNIWNNDQHVNRAAIEDFLDNLIASIADYFIIVVNDLTWQDQLFISKIAEKFSNENNSNGNRIGSKKLIVIHNWVHCTKEGIHCHFEKYLKPNYKGVLCYISDDSDIFYFNTEENFSGSGNPVMVDHYFIVGEGNPANKNKEEKEYNDKVFDHLRSSFPHLFPPIHRQYEFDAKIELEKLFNNICHKYLIADRKQEENGNNIIELNQFNEAKLQFILDENTNSFKILNCDQYNITIKKIPLSVMLSQYPSSIITPKIYYEVKNNYNNREVVEELICHFECPGCNTRSILVNTEDRKFWTLTMNKSKLDYQEKYDLTISNDLNNMPSYGKSELFIPLPDSFLPDINNYYIYYEKGVVILHALSQLLNGIPKTKINYEIVKAKRSRLPPQPRNKKSFFNF